MHFSNKFVVATLSGCLFVLSLLSIARAEECSPQSASAGFRYRGDINTTNPFAGDSGIVPNGFVEVDGTPTVQGVDVSKYENQIDFTQAVNCGARFVYVRLSAGSQRDSELEYRTLWQNARGSLRGRNGLVGGYHNLTFVENREKSGFAALGAAQKTAILDRSLKLADAQARIAEERLSEVLGLDVKADCETSDTELGCPFLPLALDLSTRPQISGSAKDKTEYGRIVYGPTICRWIDTVRASAPISGQTILLFVAPDTYKDFGLDQTSCHLEKLPVWIRDHNRSGGLPGSDLSARRRALTDHLCKPEGGADRTAQVGRCIFHQYTSFGGFAVFDPEATLDLNRFYGAASDLRALSQKAKR